MNLPIPTDSALAGFHPAVSAWFSNTFPTVTAAQARAWPLIRQRRSTLIAAPTGSGKTLTAFLAVIDDLVHRGLETDDGLPDETLVVYVSPLKALSNDIQINLQNPLAGITEQLRVMGLPPLQINTAVRTGDTPQKDRSAMRKTAPHILVTTPESLYVLLGSDSGRQMLGTTRTVIVDEIHAIAASKRGSHLALSLERLQALCAEPLVRIGLSATQKPIEAVSRFLVGRDRPCDIVDIGHARPRDLDIEVPPVPLSAVMANDVWELVYDRLAALAREHRTTLIFVNTRRLAERLSRHLSERLGKDAVAAHHGSLAKEFRLDAEQRLKRGDLQVLIATASLELGIDIGDVDLVCQIASPRSISGFLQRVGRSGHQVGGTPKGRLFATTRDDLIECAALLDCVRRGELDTLQIPTSAAGRARAANHRRGQLPGMAGAGAAGDVAQRLAVRRTRRKTLSGAAAHARRGLQRSSGHPQRLPAPRRRHPHPARSPGRQTDRRDQRRDHSGQRRLQRFAGAPRAEHRQRQRRLCGGKHCRGRVPVGQYLLPNPAGRNRQGPGRRRSGPTADHSVLAR